MANRFNNHFDPGDALRSLSHDMFQYLQSSFPICCESDEFYYFPQIVRDEPIWRGWDDFSPERVQETERKLSRFETELTALSGKTEDHDYLVDIKSLHRLSSTLRGQLTQVRFQSDQPTFYLTVACTGLAAVLESNDEEAWRERIGSLPSFLKRAKKSLGKVPVLFRDMGLKMTFDTKSWLAPLATSKPGIPSVIEALEDFEKFLVSLSTRETFLLPRDLFELVLKDHMGCGESIDGVRGVIEEEIEETKKILDEEAERIIPGGTWIEAVRHIGAPQVPKSGPTELFRREIENLLEHCIGIGIVSPDFARLYPVRVSVVPPYLATIRAASAYSFSPSGTSPGGKFSIVPPGDKWNNNREDLTDYRMLTAHETYPGHHLLDVTRWYRGRPMRRPIEMPLFYEGWACFSEELMRQTGYFTSGEDLLLLAKRRYRRALRGLVDIDLQAGTLDVRAAAACLAGGGFDERAAVSAVPKYALRPGYQVCYTFGLRRFFDLHRKYGKDEYSAFAQTVLREGEIEFGHLESALERLREDRDRSS